MSQSNAHSFGNNIGAGDSDSEYILVVDIGTTNLRGHIYDIRSRLIGESVIPIELLNPRLGYYEIDAQSLWEAFLLSIQRAIECMTKLSD
ncbi:unnamed protein product [Oppiella nova]|uniref:Carbohydrate kinase FGGY N-terminal domain-containing protein n=1 Tax=Oppiella nova TaxID=334625 RepID=A0A7R9LMI9_9ACAR|nr:unnamed protein product [Oppiella nova]CAG2164483.1 unnamed protein product [Oppiella nova]